MRKLSSGDKYSKLSEKCSIEEAKEFIQRRIKAHQKEVEAVVEKQMQKWRTIKEKRQHEETLLAHIKEKEQKLAEASKHEDYDLADKLQGDINKELQKIEAIGRLMLDLEKQRAELEAQIKNMEDNFIKMAKEDISTLIEIETKQTTEKNIFEKTEEEHIDDIRATLRSKDIRVEETAKEIDKKIQESQDKLSEIEDECRANAKDFISQKDKLEADIKAVDAEIAELEKKLKQKIDQKHTLEEKREKAVKEIKKVNKEFEADIEELTDLKEKYERKKMVNIEKKDALEAEKKKLEEKEEEVKLKITEFEAQIEGFAELTRSMKANIKKKERSITTRQKMVKEYEQKQQEYRDLVQTITQCNKDVKQNEAEINNYDDELDDYCQKLNELDKTIEGLEEEKKTLAQKKKFKDAKRVKETLALKTEKRDAIEIKIKELKEAKETAEENISQNKKMLKKLTKKKTTEELKLREYEYNILCLKRREIKASYQDSEAVQEADTFKIINREIVEMEEKYGFTENSDSENESKLSIDNRTPTKKPVDTESEKSVEEPDEEVEE